jgi:hypothetical protein
MTDGRQKQALALVWSGGASSYQYLATFILVAWSLGGRAFCSVPSARFAGSSFTCAEHSAIQTPGALCFWTAPNALKAW